MAVSSVEVLSRHLKPLCPRHNHVMKFESSHARLNPEHEPSYHCGFQGCTVRYDLVDGYYTLIGVDSHFYRLAEPGVNTLRCPVHNGWLYIQESGDTKPGARWCCGVEPCDYCFSAPTKGEWVRG